MRGEMTITITLPDAGNRSEVVSLHESFPDGILIADNEAGWRMALARRAALVESNQRAGNI